MLTRPSLNPSCFAPLLALAFAATVTSTVSAQNAGKGPAYVVPPDADPAYPLMGEFVGQIKTGGKKKKHALALQIRPLANNQFQAMAFHGGLPGEPGHKQEEMRLIGLRANETLVLSGGPWAVFVDADGCNIVSSQGKMLGRLKRVERVSPTLGAKPPKDAIVLFDGDGVDQFVGGEMTDGGLLKEGALINPMFQDFNLHVEFRLPYMPKADGQQRGNSGLYLQSRYECQILDSFGTEKMFNGLGSLYRTKAPDLNMAFPPLRWQTYDIHFTAPRWASDGTKVRNAHVTSWINGVKVQDNVSLPNKTGAGQKEEPLLLPIRLQDHGDPVRFRNIWIVDRGISGGEFPITSSKKERAEAAMLEWNLPKEPEAKAETAEETKSESKEEAKPDGESKPAEASDSPKKADEPSGGAAEPKSKDQGEATAESKVPTPDQDKEKQPADDKADKSTEDSAAEPKADA